MNNKQLDALIRDGADVMASMGEGLYFRLARGTPSWVVKYTLGGKRSQISLPNAYPTLSIVQAKQTALEIRSDVKLGIDPKSERKKATFKEVRTVNDLFEDWHQSYIVPNFKNPQIPARYYHKEMKRHIGVITVKDVTPHHIRAVINEVTLSGRKTVANKTLMYARQMFNHAVKLNLINFNPAMAFTFKDAGGPEQPRSRTLGLPEIHYVFSAFRNHQQIFTRDNYLAACLLMCLGCRKGELIAARWDQFDFEEMVWQCLPNKKRFNMEVQPIVIPLPKLTLQWFQELKIRSDLYVSFYMSVYL